MTVITKAALAAALGVTKARVSQYVKSGLPVRSDGKIDYEAAVKWIAQSHVDDGRGRAGGVKRAVELAAAAKRRSIALPEPQDATLGQPIVEAVGILAGRAGSLAAAAALDAGASARVAFAIEFLVAVRIGELAESVLDEAGVYRSVVALERVMDPVVQRETPDWASHAKARRERFDEEAWIAASERALNGEAAHV